MLKIPKYNLPNPAKEIIFNWFIVETWMIPIIKPWICIDENDSNSVCKE